MSGLGAIYDITLSALRMHAQTLARLQEQASSGSRINRASDSPADASEAMALGDQMLSMETYSGNIDRVVTDLNQSSGVIQDITDSLTRVRQLLTQAASGTYGTRDRLPIGQEINSILEQALSEVNIQNLGRYIFGGFDASRPPYAVQREGGKITSVTYQGQDQDLPVPVAPGVEQSGLLVGDDVFRSDGRGSPQFLGTTGAKAGSGTSSVRGDVWLTVLHTATSYAGATGVASGSGASSDTIIGSHTLIIDADARTVQLDDGAAAAFTAGDSNLCLTNAAGEKVYVDMSKLDAALSGTVSVAVTATGRLSLDDCATTVAISGSQNQAVVDSRTGQVLYVDSGAIHGAGSEPVRVSGTYDLFGMLISMRDVLMNDRSLTSAQQQDLLNRMIGSLDEVNTGVTEKLTAVGGRLKALDDIRNSLDNIKSNSKTQQASLTSVDVAELAVELARAQTFYQLTLSATSKFLSTSLLDYIQPGG